MGVASSPSAAELNRACFAPSQFNGGKLDKVVQKRKQGMANDNKIDPLLTMSNVACLL